MLTSKRKSNREQLSKFKTLVLNSSYEPLMTITWERAFILVWLDKAQHLESYEEYARAGKSRFEIPAVIRLVTQVPNYKRKGNFSRRSIFERDAYTCQYCGSTERHKLTQDHIIPKSRGGPRSWDNMVTACGACNTQKADRTPEEAGMNLNLKPNRPSFLKQDNFPEIWRPYLWG